MQDQGRNKAKVAKKSELLPIIPKKRYFTIGETSRLCDVKPHVLRYWEQEFPQLKPNKRRGNRRYYQQKDIMLIRQISELLYEQGYTIVGARNYLSSLRTKLADEENEIEERISLSIAPHTSVLNEAIHELEAIINVLKQRD